MTPPCWRNLPRILTRHLRRVGRWGLVVRWRDGSEHYTGYSWGLRIAVVGTPSVEQTRESLKLGAANRKRMRRHLRSPEGATLRARYRGQRP